MAKNEVHNHNVTSTVAKGSDGNVQITFNIPYHLIAESKDIALNEMAKDMEIPGFRKGKAPVAKVAEHVNQNTLLERTLGNILPKALGQAIEEHKIKPVIYPKFELVKANDNEDWQIMAVTCELPEIKLGDYKKDITGELKAKNIWTPEKGKTDDKKEMSKEEKEQEIIRVLLEKININIPKILIDEEVNNRLASLLERIERLGLTLDGYLGSLGKNVETLKNEYTLQAKSSISLELILEKIAEEEKIQIAEEKVEEAIKAASADPGMENKFETPEQKRLVASVLRRREALDHLTSLI